MRYIGPHLTDVKFNYISISNLRSGIAHQSWPLPNVRKYDEEDYKDRIFDIFSKYAGENIELFEHFENNYKDRTLKQLQPIFLHLKHLKVHIFRRENLKKCPKLERLEFSLLYPNNKYVWPIPVHIKELTISIRPETVSYFRTNSNVFVRAKVDLLTLGINRLIDLEVLHLYAKSFAVDIEQLGNLPRLRDVSMIMWKSKISLSSTFKKFSNYPNLTHLHLDYAKNYERIPESEQNILPVDSRLSSLQHLSLMRYKLTDENLIQITENAPL